MRYMRASYFVERPVRSRVLSVLPYQVSRARENDIQLNAAKSCYSVRTIPPKGSNQIPVELKGNPIKVSTRTRKFSCVNARGIPTRGWVPPPAGVLPPPGLMGVFPYQGEGYPTLDTPCQTWLGVPLLGEFNWNQSSMTGWTWLGPPPPPPPQVWTDKQSETITSYLVLRTWSVTIEIPQRTKAHQCALQKSFVNFKTCAFANIF